MSKDNKDYIQTVNISDIPWHRLVCSNGRGVALPKLLEQFDGAMPHNALDVLNDIYREIEHQDNIWPSAPFALIFLGQIADQALSKAQEDKLSFKIAQSIIAFFLSIKSTCLGSLQDSSVNPFAHITDLLDEQYLLPELDLDEDEDDFDSYCEELPDGPEFFISCCYYAQMIVDLTLNKLNNSTTTLKL